MLTRPTNYEQTDPRWRDKMYSNHGDKSQTIGRSGCGPTCAAMAISTLRNNAVTPPMTCAWAVDHGYRTDNNGTQWSYFGHQFAVYDIECDDYTTDANKAVEAVKTGCMVIALAQKGLWTSTGHYILAYGIDGNYILINDPNSGLTTREVAPISIFKAQCSKFWIIREEWHMQESDVRRIVQEELKAANSQVSAWAIKEWDEAKSKGLTDGTRPGGVLTREQGAAMIVRALKK